MKIIVTPDSDGIISNYAGGEIAGFALPAGAIVIETDITSLPPNVAARWDGSKVVQVPDFRGGGPYYDQNASAEDRLKPIMPQLGDDPDRLGWGFEPRPETAAEKKAREKAEAEAAKNASAEVRNARTMTPVQFVKAMITTGTRRALREKLIAAGRTEDEIDLELADLEYKWEPVRFDDPGFVTAMTSLGKTEEDREAFFAAATAL